MYVTLIKSRGNIVTQETAQPKIGAAIDDLIEILSEFNEPERRTILAAASTQIQIESDKSSDRRLRRHGAKELSPDARSRKEKRARKRNAGAAQQQVHQPVSGLRQAGIESRDPFNSSDLNHPFQTVRLIHERNAGYRAPSLEGKLFLVGIGAQKAGTGWMSQYFKSHPDVYVSPLKEVHYFDAVYIRKMNGHVSTKMARQADKIATDLAFDEDRVRKRAKSKYDALQDRMKMTRDAGYPYLKFFEERVTTESVFCDITPSYSMLSAEAYADILNTHSNTRFVFVMRDPVERYWSAIRMGNRRKADADAYAAFTRFLKDDEYGLRTDYKRTIQEVEKVIPPDRIKYFFYENLFKPESINDLTSYVGVKPWPANFEATNVGQKLALKAELRDAAVKQFRHVYEYIFERFRDEVPERWRRTASAALSTDA